MVSTELDLFIIPRTRRAQARKHGYVLAIVLGVAAVTGASIGYSQSTAGSRQAWQCMLIEWSKMGEAGLARLGAQGWELVTVDTEVKSDETYFYFNRPK